MTLLDPAGYLPRVRRLADLSQRDLAAALDVSRATVGRWESGAIEPSVAAFVRALSLAGLRLAVLDATGSEVPPFHPDSATDNGGRRFPAHLDVQPPRDGSSSRGLGPRRDRPPPLGWYELRAARDGEAVTGAVARNFGIEAAGRVAAATPQPPQRPTDHPTAAALAASRRALRAELWSDRRQDPAPVGAPAGSANEAAYSAPMSDGASNDSDIRLRGALDQVPAYVPGKPATPREGVTAYKVSSNENPYPPLPSVLEVVREAAGQINRYPDMAVTALTEAIANRLGVPAEHVATGTGSVGVLGQVIQATCDPGDEVVYAWRSFEAYPIVTALAGARSVQVGLDEQARHRLDAMHAAITERTKVVIVCTPNNPTGPMVTHTELERFLERVPSRVLVVIDEAYLEFVNGQDAPRSLELYRDRPNVMVLRTFSKAYGLAGLRVGYAVAHEPVAAALRKTAVPFGVNSLAQAAAIASLEAFDELKERVDALVAERTRVVEALRAQGWFVPDTQANFVWFALGERSADFAAAAQEAGLTLRQYGNDGVRATIGEAEANDLLIDVARQFLADHPVPAADAS